MIRLKKKRKSIAKKSQILKVKNQNVQRNPNQKKKVTSHSDNLYHIGLTLLIDDCLVSWGASSGITERR